MVSLSIIIIIIIQWHCNAIFTFVNDKVYPFLLCNRTRNIIEIEYHVAHIFYNSGSTLKQWNAAWTYFQTLMNILMHENAELLLEWWTQPNWNDPRLLEAVLLSLMLTSKLKLYQQYLLLFYWKGGKAKIFSETKFSKQENCHYNYVVCTFACRYQAISSHVFIRPS